MITRVAGMAAVLILLALAYAFLRPAPVAEAEETGRFVWTMPGEPRFGGFSGLEVAADGHGFLAVTDQALFLRGRLQRQKGRITGVLAEPFDRMVSDMGDYHDELQTDTEGLAVAPDGRTYVSVESFHGLLLFLPGHSDSISISPPAEFARFGFNHGIEALALDPDGRLVAIPERWPEAAGEMPVFRSKAIAADMPIEYLDVAGTDLREAVATTEWDTSLRLPLSRGFDPVGADFGPDGRLYVLERRFVRPLGFASQIRSFEYGSNGLTDERLLLRTRLRRFDNLEGISVWGDAETGLTITLISDDNLNWFQKTEIVEYRLGE